MKTNVGPIYQLQEQVTTTAAAEHQAKVGWLNVLSIRGLIQMNAAGTAEIGKYVRKHDSKSGFLFEGK